MSIHDQSIRITMGLVLVALMLVGGLSVGTSLWAIRSHQQDALIMNLAGRQRMLSQKTAEEAWLGLQKGQDPRYLARMHTTAIRFGEGLQALMDGGQITYAGTTVSVPPATDPAFRAALEDVQTTWEPLHRAAHAVLESEPGSPAFTQGVEDLERLSGVILEKMDAAVRVYQAAAEARVARLRWIELAFLLAGAAVLALGSGLILGQVLRPISALETAVRRMEQGDLDDPIQVRVPNELGRLAGAFDDMRVRVRARLQEQAALLHLSRTLVGLTDPRTVMDAAAGTVQETLLVDYVSVMTPDPGGRWLVLAGGAGWEPELYGHYRVEIETSQEGHVFRSEEPVQQPDGSAGLTTSVQSGEPFPCPMELRERGVVSSVTVPLRGEGGTLGTFCAHTTQPRQFSPDDVHLLSLIANQTAMALERIRTDQQVIHQAAELSARQRVTQAVLHTVDLEERLRIALREILALVGERGSLGDWETRGQGEGERRSEGEVSLSPPLPVTPSSLRGAIYLVEGERLVLREERGFSEEFMALARDLPLEACPWAQIPTVMHAPWEGTDPVTRALQREGVMAWTSLPLMVGERLDGVLLLADRRTAALEPDTLRALSALAEQVAVVLHNARLYAQGRERLARLTTLREIDRAIAAQLSLDEVIRVVLERVAPHIHVDAVGLSLIDWEKKRTILGHLHLPGGGEVHGEAFTLSDSLLEWLVVRRQPVMIYDLLGDPRLRGHRDLIRRYGLKSYLGVPLVVQDRTIGVLHVFTVEPHAFSAEEADFFATMAGQTAISIQNARMYEAALQRGEALAALARSTLSLTQAGPEPEVIRTLLQSAGQATGAVRGAWLAYDPANHTLHPEALIGFPPEAIPRAEQELSMRLGDPWAPAVSAVEGRPIYLRQTHDSPLWPDSERALNSAYCVPLTYGGRLYGVFVLLAEQENAFDAETRALADTFAAYAAGALNNAYLFQETRRRAAHLEALNAIIAAAAGATHLSGLLETTLDHTLQALGLEMGAIWLGQGAAERGSRGAEVQRSGGAEEQGGRGTQGPERVHPFTPSPAHPPSPPAPLYVTQGLSPEIGLAMARAARATGLDIPGPLAVEDWPAIRGAARSASGGPSGATPPSVSWLTTNKAVAEVMDRFGIRASLTVPILVEGRRIGGLGLAAREPRSWSAEEVALAEAVGRQLGAAAERLSLLLEAQAHADLKDRLASLSEALNRPSAVGDVVAAIGQGALALSSTDRVAVYLRHSDDTVTCPWSRGLSPGYLEQVTTRVREVPGGRLLESSQPVLIPQVEYLPEDTLLRDLAEAEGYRAAGLWPLVYEGRVIAAVGCYYTEPHTWSEAEQEVMHAFARQAAVALENARLFEALQSRVGELSALAEASAALRGATTAEEMAPLLAAQAARLVQADAAALCLVDEARQRVVTLGVAGLPPEAVGRHHGVEEGITGQVIRTGAICRSVDLARDSRVAHRDLMAGLGPGVCVPLRTTAGQVVGTLLVARRRQPEGEATSFRREEERLLETLAEMAGNALQRAWTHEQLEAAYIETVLALANAMDARDTYTGNHSQRLATWAEATARELGYSEEEIEAIRWGALLHDIGKIGVPDAILRKPGPLNDEERAVIERHPEIGAEIVAPVKRLVHVAPIIRAHQEHWDGNGYPDGLRGEAIPLGARVLAVVDAYGAIIDERPYKKAGSHEEAVAELKRCAGTQFDPQVVEAFLRVLEHGVDIPGG